MAGVSVILAVGCGGDEDHAASDAPSRPADAVRACLKSTGFEVVSARPELGGAEEPDLEIIATRGDDENVFLAFYDDLERARRLEPSRRKEAKGFDGEVRRIDRVTIIWTAKPSRTARRSVENCVTG